MNYLGKCFKASKQFAVCAGLIGAFGFSSTLMAATGGTPAYQLQTIPFQWIDATTGTKQETGLQIPIGFSFQYYGVAYDRLAIGGGQLFMGPYDPNVFHATTINAHRDPTLYTYSFSEPGKGVYTKLEGSAPNRKFTVSWVNAAFIEYLTCPDEYCPTTTFGKVSFQATLYEGSNDIIYRYLDLIASDEAGAGYTNHDNRVSAAVDVANTGFTQGTVYSPLISNGTALRFFVGSPANLSPIADAGPDLVVNQRETGVLNGTGSSDSSDRIASYLWRADFIPLDSPNTASTTFTAPLVPVDTTRTAYLTVTDNKGAYSTDAAQVTIRNVDVNQPPSANAGPDQTVTEGDRVRLNGTGTDPEGYTVTYQWTQTAGPAVTFISPPGSASESVHFDAPNVPADTTSTFQLTVRDIKGAIATDTVNVLVRNGPNFAPTANAGPDFTATQKTTVTLNASASSDRDGSIVAYKWQQIAGKTVTLKNANSATPTFIAPSTDTTIQLAFEVTVTDNNGATSRDGVVGTIVKR